MLWSKGCVGAVVLQTELSLCDSALCFSGAPEVLLRVRYTWRETDVWTGVFEDKLRKEKKKTKFFLLTFLVFSDSSSSVLSTSFLKEGLFKGSWFQQDSIISYLNAPNQKLYLQLEVWGFSQGCKKTRTAQSQTNSLFIIIRLYYCLRIIFICFLLLNFEFVNGNFGTFEHKFLVILV